MTDVGPPHEDGVALTDGTVDSAHRVTLSYIDRSRRFYAAKGYDRPYRWLTNDSAPFTTPRKPVAASRIAIVTTSSPVEEAEGASGPRPSKVVRALPAEPPPESMDTNDVFWHRGATNTDDVESFLPLRTMARFVADGRVGSLNDRYFAIPTSYSRRSTQVDAETIADWCGDDGVDLVILVPL